MFTYKSHTSHIHIFQFCILFMFADDRREIERLESLLKRCSWEKEQLEQQLRAKDHLIQNLNENNAILQSANNNFASARLYTHQNSEGLQQKINRLQKFLQQQAFECDYLQQSKLSLMREVVCLRKSNDSNLSLLESKDLMISRLRLRIKQLEDINRIHENQIEVLNTNIKNYGAEKNKMIQINTNMALKIKQEEAEKQSNFKILLQGLNSLNAHINAKPTENKRLPKAETNDHTIIFKLQHEELQERNEEIIRLRGILDRMQVPTEELHLRNTIKHLRAELAKHNQKISSVLQKEQLAEQLIKKYSQTISKYEKEVQDIAKLKEQKTSLQQKVEELQFEISEMIVKQEEDKKMRLQNTVLFADILKENQCFHQMMYENYSSKYEFYIQSRKADFEKRLQERVKREKWATIDELIDVNQKLRQKLKLI